MLTCSSTGGVIFKVSLRSDGDTFKYPCKLLLITRVQRQPLEILKQHVPILALSKLPLSFTQCVVYIKCLGPM